MKRLLILLALAGLTTAAACGDDGEPTKKPVDTKDAGGTTPVADTGVPAARPVQVENPGAACTKGSTTDCKGVGALCQSSIMVGMNAVPLEGGYCSAQCTSAAECSPGGGCPAAEITALLPPALAGLASGFTGLIPSNCLDKCDVKVAGDCRTGYSCKSLGDLLPPELAAMGGAFISGIPALKTTYCLPPINLGDAGVPALPVADAGRSGSLDGGVDGGL